MSKTTVLIVEDEAIVAADLAGKLAQGGYEVVGNAATGAEAVALAGRLRPQVVLMDIWLKGPMDGIAAAEAIRRQVDTPIIYLTAHSDPATLERAKLTGPFGYILKPFEERELATQIEMAIYKHQAERQLRQQSEWLRVTLSSIGDAVIACDTGGRITFLNPVAETLTGWKSEEAVGQPIQSVFRIINERTRQPAEDIAARVLREGLVVALANHTALIAHDGREIPIEDSAAPILDAAGQVLGVVLVFHNVTEKRRAEEALQKSEGLLRAIMDNSPDPIFLKDRDSRLLLANFATLAAIGKTAEEVIGKTDEEFYDDPAIGRAIVENDRRIMDSGQTEVIEDIVQSPAGPSRIYLSTKTPYRDAEGQIIGLIGLARDITERKRAEEALRASQSAAEKYASEMAALMDAVPAAIFIAHDVECRQITGSRATQEMLGLPATANFSKSASPAERPTNFRAMKDGREIPADQLPVQSAARGQEVRDYEFDVVFADGEVRTLLGDAVPLLDKSGKPYGAIGAFIEITKRKRAEEALHNSERMYRAIGESIDYGIWICAPDGRNTYASESFLKLVGITQEQCSEFGWGDILHPDDMEHTIAAWKECVRTGETWDIEHRCKGVDGQWHAVLARGVPVRDEKGEITCWAGINLDISRQKKAEQVLRDADRHKDEFLAMLAHELRNPLAPVRNAVAVLRVAGPADPRLQRQREIIERQVTHMARLLDDLLDVSRVTRGKIVLEKKPLALVDVLAHAAETAAPLVEARRHQLHVSLPADGLRVEGDLDRLAQAVGNLLANAAKYTDEGGQIWLEAAAENGDAVVRVRDTGMGIAPEILPHVFDLFTQADRTLGHAQGGLGIGLTMVQKLTQLHGGVVQACSEGLGRGSEFTIRLPALPTPAPAPEPVVPEKALTRPEVSSSWRILVVDDLVDSAETLAELLGLWGHEVRTAHGGLPALMQVREFKPEVVLLDIGLPDLDGHEVARRLREEHGPGRMVLVAMTGYGQESDRQQTCKAGFDHHLVKPVDLCELQNLLAQISF